MPESIEIQLPLSITILSYITAISLVAILVLLFRINARVAALSHKLTKGSRSSKLAEPDAEPQEIDVPSGTRYEEFLNEDPQRRALAKKEQFKAYRKWRAEKGLNWSTKD